MIRVDGQEGERYTIALACGHYTEYEAEKPRGAIEWCPLCREYVGVIVLRTDPPGRTAA